MLFNEDLNVKGISPRISRISRISRVGNLGYQILDLPAGSSWILWLGQGQSGTLKIDLQVRSSSLTPKEHLKMAIKGRIEYG